MDVKIYPSELNGTFEAVSLKAPALRYILAASLSLSSSELCVNNRSAEVTELVRIISDTVADIKVCGDKLSVSPKEEVKKETEIRVGAGAAALRFLLPTLCALSERITITGDGAYFKKYVKEITESLHGVTPFGETLPVTLVGRMRGGAYELSENAEPYFVNGLLFALSLTEEGGEIFAPEKLVGAKHVAACIKVMNAYGAKAEVLPDRIKVYGRAEYRSPGEITVNGDRVSSAAFIASKVLGGKIEISNLCDGNAEPDILEIMQKAYAGGERISLKNCASAACFAAIVACFSNGDTVIERALNKPREEERARALVSNILRLGGRAEVKDGEIRVYGTGGLNGGVYTDSFGDAKIAEAIAVAATFAKEPVILLSAECANKDIPDFYNELRRLGGKVESR